MLGSSREDNNRTSKSLHLKATNKIELRKGGNHLKNNSHVDGSGKTICVLEIEKKGRSQQICTQR